MSEQIINETTNEVASVGDPGTTIRGDRLYHNATIYHEDVASIEEIFVEMAELLSADGGETISRLLFRGIVSPETMQNLLVHDLADRLEVAQPLEEYGEPGWLVYLAANSPGREPIVPVPEMVESTNIYTAPADFTPSELPEGFLHRSYIPKESTGQLLDLWTAFEWELEGVKQRANRIRENSYLESADRDTWFSGLWNGNILVCAATAERLTYLGAKGPFDVVESTEWRTHPDYMQRGLMGHNLWRLNNQVLQDLRTDSGKTPLIFAECNFMTRADKAGRRAGFNIPSRLFAGQIIVQNVTVNDGHEPPGHRDFVYVSLPAQHGVNL